MKLLTYILLVVLSGMLSACKMDREPGKNPSLPEGKSVPVKYASGLSIKAFKGYTLITVSDPWPGAEHAFRYLLTRKGVTVPKGLEYDQQVSIPVDRIVVTSTTHIPSLEALDVAEALVGFPGLDYISSSRTRGRIAQGKILDVGQNEALNTESLLDLRPDVIVGFSINGSNKSLETLKRSGIPVVFNADWTESSPLGKAEWIKFFGALFDQQEKARKIFDQVEKAYLSARALAKQAKDRPTVIAGAMYKDQWFLPAGDSWQAHFLEDANSEYLFADSEGSGSLSLSLEAVLSKAANADFWIGPAQFKTYEGMQNASAHYARFSPFKTKKIYTFSSVRGTTGGVLFYELAPNRPDLVLKDLIAILHPELLPDHETTFYKPLE